MLAIRGLTRERFAGDKLGQKRCAKFSIRKAAGGAWFGEWFSPVLESCPKCGADLDVYGREVLSATFQSCFRAPKTCAFPK